MSGKRRYTQSVVAGVLVASGLAVGGVTVVDRAKSEPVAAVVHPVPSSPGPEPAPTTAAPTSPAPDLAPAPSLLPKSAAPVAAAPKPRGSDCLKGVGTWDTGGGQKTMLASGSCWYYTWSPKDWFGAPAGVEFVPMIWGEKSMPDLGVVQGKTLLGFNEPDLKGQADMSVERALELWPQLQAKNMRLGSPSPAWGGDVEGGWLDRFMKGANERGYRVDFITLHFYTKNFDTATAVRELREYVQKTYDRFRKPIWVTEFALINHDNMTYPPPWQTAAFVRESTKLLTSLPYVERYAWFALPQNRQFQTGLFFDDGKPTEAGREFQAAPRTK